MGERGNSSGSAPSAGERVGVVGLEAVAAEVHRLGFAIQRVQQR